MTCVVCDPAYIWTQLFGRSGAIYSLNAPNFEIFSDLNKLQVWGSDNPYEIIHDSKRYRLGTVVAYR